FDAAAQLAGATYDGLGRLTGDASRSFAWNGASQLNSYTAGADSATYLYDALGMRTTRTSAGVTQTYVWNYALGMPAIATVRQGGSDRRYYVHAPDGSLLYAIEAADNTHHYFHFDETGSTLFLSGDAGTVTDAYGITPYGDTV